MKLSDLLTDIQFKGNFNDCEIHAITHDSRKVKNGSLFVAIHGLITDGHDFIPEAVQNGAPINVLAEVKNSKRTKSRFKIFQSHPNKTKYKYVFRVFSQPNSDKANFVYMGEKK